MKEEIEKAGLPAVQVFKVQKFKERLGRGSYYTD
jgi:hypothetical protein